MLHHHVERERSTSTAKLVEVARAFFVLLSVLPNPHPSAADLTCPCARDYCVDLVMRVGVSSWYRSYVRWRHTQRGVASIP